MLSGGRRKPLALPVMASVLALAGCGGGGGGGGGGGAAAAAPATAPAPVSQSVGFILAPANQEQINSNNALGPINALVPASYGILGQGQVVADFDTGADASNPDLNGQILTTEAYLVGTGPQTIATDEDNTDAHGTAVSSIIAGVIGGEVQGVAPDAQVVPIEIPEDAHQDFVFTDAGLANAVDYLNNTLVNVHVANNSWNISGGGGQGLSIQQYEAQNHGQLFASLYPQTVAAWQTFVNNGNVVVWAAGNETAAEPDAFAGLPLEIHALLPGWAVAVAISPGGGLASYSNACGSTAAFCIAAVGGGLNPAAGVSVAVSHAVSASGYVLNGYAGTSFAAPEVSGAIAVLMSAPGAGHLSAQQALQILFMTANDTGIYANSAIYGHGVLDLDAAMGPIGQPVIISNGVDPVALASTALVLGTPFGIGPMKALAATPLTVLDAFGRGYVVSLGGMATPGAPSFDAADRLGLFGKPDQTIYNAGGGSFELVVDADPRIASPDSAGTRFIAGQRFGAEATLSVAAGVDPARLLPSGGEGAAAALAQGTLAPGAAANPYFALMDKPMAMGTDLQLGGTRVAVVGAVGAPVLPAGMTMAPDAPQPRIFATDIEAEHKVGAAGLVRLDAGTMVESNTLLGSYATGAVQMSRSETWFAGIGGEYRLDPQTSLVAGFHVGLTSSDGVPGSMFAGAANIGSYAAGIGVVRHDWLRDGDRLTLGLAMPLRAVSGHADLLVPTTVNFDGTVTPRTVSIGMNADGSEVDLQGAWSVPIADSASVTTGLLWRKDPDNIRGAPMETIAATRLDFRF
jgi:hypothetical protein